MLVPCCIMCLLHHITVIVFTAFYMVGDSLNFSETTAVWVYHHARQESLQGMGSC